ncbi:hypothetical protein M0R89_19420 (plasmid) [Halorussus limi]|uniref:Uncharacterized protein n=1 Tax=Halorussus limi TaxID=2938695 RepID=A0A8U0I0J7_9EURY|nr:hypothetical protein [Halorussus limi]UPV76334.1 hypothetical protein M0R89_19420 [Halorussus limi]
MILPAIFVLVGLLGIVGLLQPLRLVQTVVSTGVSAPNELGHGREAVIGTLEADDSTVRAPVSGTECVGYVLAREVKHRTSATGIGLLLPRWYRKDVHYELPPMSLADGDCGRVRVEFDTDVESWREPVPNGLFSNLQFGSEERRRYDESESPSDAVRSVLGEPSEVSSPWFVFGIGSHPHRYTEWRLEEGDRLYLLGHTDDATRPTVRERIDEITLLDLNANSRLRLVGLLVVRFVAAGALAAFGFGAALVSL